MKYTKLFNIHTDYNTYENSSLYIKPNICYCKDDKDVHYNQDAFIIATFDISTNFDVSILYSNVTSLSELYIDNIKQETILSYYNMEPGIHKVKYKFKNNSIPTWTYYNIRNMIKIELIGSIPGLTRNMFNGCRELRDIVLPKHITEIPYDSVFRATGLVSYEVPEGITTIDSYAFYNCLELTTIALPSTLKILKGNIFQFASNLKTVHIKNINNYINITMEINWSCPTVYGALLFCNGKEVTKVYMNICNPNIFYNCKSLLTVILRDGITTIGTNCFCSCSNLTNVNIPSSVTTINSNAFRGTNISKIIIPHGVTYLGDHCFYSCRSLKEVYIPSTVNFIGNECFRESNGISKVYIEDIDAWCRINFDTTSQSTTNPLTHAKHLYLLNGLEITSITVPNDVTKLLSTFSGGTLFNNIILPEGLLEIGFATFYNCSNLRTITIPSTVTTIGSSVFGNCSKLLRVIILATTPPTLSNINSFSSSKNYFIYVPDNSVASYKSANVWSSLENRIKPISTLTDPNEIIITSLTNPEAMEVMYSKGYCCSTEYMLKDEASYITSILSLFSYNNKITHFEELQYFTNVTNVGLAFRDCTNLVRVVLPSTLTTLSNDIFRGCINLESVGSIDNITIIGSQCFSTCAKLNLTIPSNLISCGDHTFLGCLHLPNKLVMPSTFNKAASLWLWNTNVQTLELTGINTETIDLTFRTGSPLTTVVIRNGTTVLPFSFSYVNGTGSIYVPDALVEDYKTTYTNVATKIKPLSEYTE